MIEGFATVARTAAKAGRFKKLAYRRLGRSGLWVSGAGFGGYRVADGEEEHERALYEALRAGINLIDTSANYGDGLSERLIGKVLARCINEGILDREDVVVVSKAGYLQGQNYSRSQQQQARGEPFPDLVKISHGLEHCIHPDFLKDQITRSLERLELQTLDILLLHNPEYYLTQAEQDNVAPETARQEYERRIKLAFNYLETEVTNDRIRGYGVSSNTFPVPRNHFDFSDLERFWEIAESLSTDHHFHAVQFPMNLVETGGAVNTNQASGRTLLATCHDHHLGTLINRPLNAIVQNNLVRLAEAKTFFPVEHPRFQDMARQCSAILDHARSADPTWTSINSLSQMAILALLSTEGISSVLVGMRRLEYVADVLACLNAPITIANRDEAWSKLKIH